MKKFKHIFTNQHYIYWLFLFMVILPNFIMFFTESTSLLTRIVQIVLPLGFYAWAFTWARKPGKMFWWLFWFMFVDAFQIVLLWLYGESPIAVDMFLNVLTTNPGEATELLANLLVAVIFVIGLYGFGIAMSIVSLRAKTTLSDKFRRTQRRWSIPLLVAGLVMLAANYMVDKRFRAQDDVFPSRADNWSLYGYNRNTNPGSSALDNLVVYRDAITMSNTTHKSVPTLMSSAGCEAYDSLYYRKGIITAFNEVGYKTAFYSNQQRNRSFIDAFGSEAQEVKFLKDKVSLMELRVSNYDDELVDCVKKRLEQYDGGKLFIVVHMYGSHFNYKDRYPRNEAFFKPDNVISAERVYRRELINAYDNTIRNTDKVLAAIIREVDAKGVNSAVVFTSDHGEDIFDDNRGRFLHASPIPTYYQLRVPLLVWTSQSFAEQHPDAVAQLKAHAQVPVSTNMVVFHTLLDLSGVNTPYKKDSLALSNKAFKGHNRLYINDHNEYRSLDNCGLKQIDVDVFKKNKLQFP